jgi:type I restriction enzyme R subunit
VDEVDAEKIKNDPRLPFGLPGVNKKGAVSNGNYLWISYFFSYLNELGRAGFVMSSQASSAGGGEAKVRQIDWMKTTRKAVVISEEQGEMDKFRKWDMDITPHRQLIKQGFETTDGKRIDIDMAFKKEEHPFRIAIVCAMWLTGFDVPSLATLYLDKPLKAHTLMQAIARANRVNEGKNNGLIVDYCGILKNLRIALATFAGHKGDNGGKTQPGVDPVKPADEELLGSLEEAIAMVRGLLETHNFRLEDVLEKTGFERNKSIADAKEIINRNDETRKRFEIMAREFFKKFKACITIKSASKYREQYDAGLMKMSKIQVYFSM